MNFSSRRASAKNLINMVLIAAVAVLLTACGGGGGGQATASASLAASSALANKCDGGGSEKAYLRSFIDETYLWYRDVPNLNADAYGTPKAYFADLKTTAKTATGALLDQFHYTEQTASYGAASSGFSVGYGIQWVSKSSYVPRSFMVASVEPGSAAALAGVLRGDVLSAVDGVNFVSDNTQQGVDVLNAGLYPGDLNPHKFSFNGNAAVSLAPSVIATATVHNVKTLPTATGTLGYFTFDAHLAKSESELIAAINQLKAANVTDLVIDMRYNGGGLLYIASELAYMVAGPANTAGKTFEQLIYNDKLSAKNWSMPFYAMAGTSGPALPYLRLNHVTVLVTHGTASASESVINSLRGVDVKVDLIGDTTRGKPYGYVPQDNCGTTYFAIQFKGVNNKGFGDYAEGFVPTCFAPDDFGHTVGDPAETMLKTALTYRATKVCPSAASAQMIMRASSQKFELVRPASQEMRILSEMPKP